MIAAASPGPPPRPGAGAGRPARGVSRLVIASSLSGTILLALGAFWLSFTALRDLAVLAGIPEEQAWIWPLIVDGVILEATISVVALRNQAASARRFAWLLLSAGAAVSVAANVTHAAVAADARVGAVIAALVASVPPLVLLAMTHLTVELLHNADTPSEPDVDAPTPEQATVALLAAPARTRQAPAAIERAARPRTGSDARARAVALAADGVSQRQIAAELGVHPTTIGRWLSVPDQPAEGEAR